MAPAAGSRLERLGVPLLLAGLCLFAYWPGLTSPFTHYDDSLYIYQNENIVKPGWEGFLAQWDGSRSWAGDYVEFFPLRDTVYWLVYQRWGLDPVPFHVASLLAHLLTTLLAWRLARAVGLQALGAAFAAALFAVHPVHIESVVWVAGLKDPMYTGLMMASLLAYLRYRESVRPGWYGLALVCFSGAMLVKGMAIVTVPLMVALERWVGTPTPWRLIVQRLGGPAALTALWMAQLVLIGKATNTVTQPHGGSWTSHLVLTAWAQVVYLQQALVPYNVRFIYCFEPPAGLLDWRLGVALLAGAGVVALVVRWRRVPFRLLAVSWYFLCLFPVANVIPFPTVMQDRYLYAAVFGVALLAAELVQGLDPRLTRVLAPAALLLLGAVTAARSSLWQDEEQLWIEPDLDPACMADRSFPAAQTHMLRFLAGHDPEARLEAFERLVASPGFLVRPKTEICSSLEMGVHLAVKQNVKDRAGGWVVMMLERCASFHGTWRALTAFELHRHPRWAAKYSDRAFRLEGGSSSKALRGVAHLEAGDPRGHDWALEAVRDDPLWACPVVRQFHGEVGPALQARLADVLAACPPEP